VTQPLPLPDLLDRPYEELIGLVAIGSSSLDHAMRILHAATTVNGNPDGDPWDELDMNMSRSELSKSTRAGWRVWVEHGLLSGEAMAAGSAWIGTTLDLLKRRDVVVHALWEVDTALPEGLKGRHLRTKHAAPDLASIRLLALQIREHLADDRLRIVWDGITNARLGG
jgi:hypothetical protein